MHFDEEMGFQYLGPGITVLFTLRSKAPHSILGELYHQLQPEDTTSYIEHRHHCSSRQKTIVTLYFTSVLSPIGSLELVAP